MNFVIIASARTGSSHLVNTLVGHPQIFCHGNVFADHMMAVFWPRTSAPHRDAKAALKSELRLLRGRDPDGFMQRVFLFNHGRPHVGFKIFRGQNDEILKKIVRDGSLRKIVLFRRNVLANYSSAMAAKMTQVWGVVEGDGEIEVAKVAFKEREFIHFHNAFVSYYSKIFVALNRYRQQFHLIDYEEINEPDILAGLINFIGADPAAEIDEAEVHKHQVKQNSSNVLDRFSEPDIVEAFLKRINRLHWKYEGEMSLAPIAE